jgi:hypothetical protein
MRYTYVPFVPKPEPSRAPPDTAFHRNIPNLPFCVSLSNQAAFTILYVHLCTEKCSCRNTSPHLLTLARPLPGNLPRLGMPLLAEDAGKNLVHIFQLAWKVEGVFDLLARDAARDLLISQHELVEI